MSELLGVTARPDVDYILRPSLEVEREYLELYELYSRQTLPGQVCLEQYHWEPQAMLPKVYQPLK